jgi:hypothetical protein
VPAWRAQNQEERSLVIGWRTRNAQEPEFVSFAAARSLSRFVTCALQSLIIFADSLRFSKVDTGRPGDRVYMLFSESKMTRRFFWLQDSDDSKDEDMMKRLRELLKSPPTVRGPGAGLAGLGGRGGGGGMGIMQAMAAANAAAGGRGGGPGSAAAQAMQMQQLLAAMSPDEQDQLAGMMGAMGEGGMSEDDELAAAIAASTREASGAPSSSSAATSAPAPSPAPVPAPAPAATPAPASSSSSSGQEAASSGAVTEDMLAAAMEQAMAMADPTPSLALVANPTDALAVATASEEVQARLAELLPEGQRSREDLEAAIRSPQLRQALSSLSNALENENFETVFANFGLNPEDGAEAMARGDPVGAFLAALRAKILGPDAAADTGEE